MYYYCFVVARAGECMQLLLVFVSSRLRAGAWHDRVIVLLCVFICTSTM